MPYFFPTAALLAGMEPSPGRCAARRRPGSFCYDTMTLVGPGTWEAARAAVDCALTAVDLVAGGRADGVRAVPAAGHHVTPAGYGGSCYLNNAAVAAEALRTAGHERVAVIDVDAHHGNGTQAIFWERSDVLYGSVHVDPAAGWFPHVVRARVRDRRGRGRPAPPATSRCPRAPATRRWLEAVGALAAWVGGHGCSALVVSLGVDAAADDPESPLLVTADGYREAGRVLGGLGPADGRGPGGRLPPAEPRRTGRGLPRRARGGGRRAGDLCAHPLRVTS